LPSPLQIVFVLGIGVLSVSTSAIFIRLAIEAAGEGGVEFSLFLAAYRMILASIVLIPHWFRLKNEHISPKAYYLAIGAGIVLASHFATWIASLSYTSIAASTILVTTNPLWVSLGSWWWSGETPRRSTFMGLFTAVVGGILIAFGDAGIDRENANPLLGNSLALIGAWMVSFYILLGREAQRQGLSVTSYITIAYSTAGLVLLPFPLLLGQGYGNYSPPVYLYGLLMAIFPQLIGHTSFNWALRWISPTLVTFVILFEPIGASIFGIILFREIPPPIVISGGMILLIGVGLAIAGTRDKPTPQQ
jgi:drug/metabolite transporter (DMT)-like permease